MSFSINCASLEIDTRLGTKKNNILSKNVLQNQEGTTDKNIDFENEDKIENLLEKQLKSIAVFEGFFDFLSYQTIHQNKEQELTNFLVLNSISFFERSPLLMEKHERIHLYLDNDVAGRKCINLAQKRLLKFSNESKLYQGYKDLNNWLVNFGKLQKRKEQNHRIHRRR
jgi:hypothetical protein